MLHNRATCFFEVFTNFSEWCDDLFGKFCDPDGCHKGNPQKYKRDTLDDNFSKYTDKILGSIDATCKASMEVNINTSDSNRRYRRLGLLSRGISFFFYLLSDFIILIPEEMHQDTSLL